MKIVQINCSASGSTGNIATAIHKKLMNLGHESYVFYEVGTAKETNMYRIGNYFSLHSHAVLSRNFGRQGYFSLIPTIRLIHKLNKITPDVIHLHNLHGSYLNLPLLFKYLKNLNTKIILTLHDCWLFTGKCPHFTVANCNKWMDTCGNCPQLSSYPRSKFDTTGKCHKDKRKWLSGFSDRLKIITVSNWLKATAEKSFLSQYKIKTIYNGIDRTVFKAVDCLEIKKKYNLDNKFVVLGVSSNWNEQKGLNEFIELSKIIADNEIIVLVGLTSDQIETMPDNIIGITRTENQAELAMLYSAADVFVNTSREETFGLVTAEAMACGTPVIVYNSTACAEIVSDNCGIILNSIDSIYDATNRIKKLEYKNIILPICFDINTMVRSYINEYNRF